MLRELGLNRFRTRFFPNQTAKKVYAILGGYAAWILAFRLMAITFVIYFLTHTSGKPVLFEEINETFSIHEISIMGFGSLAFVLLLKGFSPLWGDSDFKIVDWSDVQENFLRGFFQGALLATAIIISAMVLGTFRYVGFFVQIEDTPLAIVGILIRTIALVCFCYCEEFLFRKHALTLLSQKTLVFSQMVWKLSILTVTYCVIKLFQFEMGWMHLITLFLMSSVLSMRQLNGEPFSRGAGLWCGLLVFFQPLFSLPIFGSDFSGIFLIKYQEQTTALRLFSGGAGGPLSGIALQLVLIIELVRGFTAYKKVLRS